MKESDAQLRASAHRGLDRFQRLPVRDEHERLVPVGAPFRSHLGQPIQPRVVLLRRACQLDQRLVSGTADCFERRARRQRVTHAAELVLSFEGVLDTTRSNGAFQFGLRFPTRVAIKRDRFSLARREPADFFAPRCARARRQRDPAGQPFVEIRVLRELVGSEYLQQPEEAVRVVFKRRCRQQQAVLPEIGDRPYRAVGRVARMSRRAA